MDELLKETKVLQAKLDNDGMTLMSKQKMSTINDSKSKFSIKTVPTRECWANSEKLNGDFCNSVEVCSEESLEQQCSSMDYYQNLPKGSASKSPSLAPECVDQMPTADIPDSTTTTSQIDIGDGFPAFETVIIKEEPEDFCEEVNSENDSLDTDDENEEVWDDVDGNGISKYSSERLVTKSKGEVFDTMLIDIMRISKLSTAGALIQDFNGQNSSTVPMEGKSAPYWEKSEYVEFQRRAGPLCSFAEPVDLCTSDINQFKSHTPKNMRIHTGEKPFKCSLCSYSTVRKYHLKLHMRRHTGEKPFKCSLCAINFTQKGSLIAHMRSIHTGERPFKCAHCTFTTAYKATMISHKLIHTGERPFKCSQCSYSCLRKNDLKPHMRIHTGEKPHKCTHCTFACIRKNTLMVHMRIHTGEKPFKCSQCTYTCRDQSTMVRHMCLHTGERPHKCPLCSFACIQKVNLKRHMLSHADEIQKTSTTLQQ